MTRIGLRVFANLRYFLHLTLKFKIGMSIKEACAERIWCECERGHGSYNFDLIFLKPSEYSIEEIEIIV